MKAENSRVPTPSRIAEKYFPVTDRRYYELVEAIDAHARNYSQSKGERRAGTNKTRPGYVYVLKGGDGLYKLGFSTDPSRRHRLINTYTMFDTELIHTIRAPYMGLAEGYLHLVFKAQHVRREWFRLLDEQVKWLCSIGAIAEVGGKIQIVYERELPPDLDLPELPTYEE